ncbi:LysR family transcriptional regulator [Ensifer sp. ENS12]|uniref:LysR family transcriptional regulator n=1 Tax=Ensifer sp. ENS12 TaxID=2854774 RepID=UPI0021028562|nr:LysR family transcriptional regulator [Ensifer sp. ENS12]
MDELSAFIAVADTGSFVEAAKRLGRDATIVSRRVSQLERNLGVQLFSRTTRRVALTEVGTLYYGRVRAALEELESAALEASDFASSPRGLLRVSLPVTFGRQRVAPLLPSFLKRHPSIRIDARFADRHVDVVAEGYDVAIRVGTSVRDSSLLSRKIASFRNLLLASPQYLEAAGTPERPEDLVDHVCLGFTSNPHWPDWALRNDRNRKSVRPAGPLISDSSEALLIAAIDGLGIILTPDWLAGPAIAERRLVEVLPGWAGTDDGGVYAIMPPGRLIPTKTKLFVDEIAKSIRASWPQ